jgi:hypothetical protein
MRHLLPFSTSFTSFFYVMYPKVSLRAKIFRKEPSVTKPSSHFRLHHRNHCTLSGTCGYLDAKTRRAPRRVTPSSTSTNHPIEHLDEPPHRAPRRATPSSTSTSHPIEHLDEPPHRAPRRVTPSSTSTSHPIEHLDEPPHRATLYESLLSISMKSFPLYLCI